LVLTAVLVGVTAGDELRGPKQQTEQPAAGNRSNPNQSQLTLRAPWNLLWLNNERFVTKVRVKMYRTELVSGQFKQIVDVAVESDERIVLDNFTAGLTHGLIYTPKEPIGVGGIGSLPTGELEVITNKDSFKVVFDSRFVLGKNYWQEDNWFFCWTLAKAVDDLLWQKVGRRLKDDEFEMFSGESILKAERANYLKRVGGQPEKSK
jgi:hypothetical protein